MYLSIGMILHSYLYYHLGENVKRALKFSAINAKGGERIKPKAKEPHHHLKKFVFEFISIWIWVGLKMNFQMVSNFQLCESEISISISFGISKLFVKLVPSKLHTYMKNFNWYNFTWYPFRKPSWKLRGEFIKGSFYLVKGKAFEVGGGISNLKNASCNLIPIPLTICKRFFEKIFRKDLQK
jgi:hypothetical protein